LRSGTRNRAELQQHLMRQRIIQRTLRYPFDDLNADYKVSRVRPHCAVEVKQSSARCCIEDALEEVMCRGPHALAAIAFARQRTSLLDLLISATPDQALKALRNLLERAAKCGTRRPHALWRFSDRIREQPSSRDIPPYPPSRTPGRCRNACIRQKVRWGPSRDD
jgi:hypothetical protein